MKNSYVKSFVIIFFLIAVSGCVIKTPNDERSAPLSDTSIAQNAEEPKRYIYLVVPDGMEVRDVSHDFVDTIGCNDALVRIEDNTLTSPVQALEKMIAYNDVVSGYYNSLAASHLTVAHVMTDEDGGTNVFLIGELRIGGVCDVPRMQAQLEQTVQQYDENSLVQIFVNDVPLEDILSEK